MQLCIEHLSRSLNQEAPLSSVVEPLHGSLSNMDLKPGDVCFIGEQAVILEKKASHLKFQGVSGRVLKLTHDGWILEGRELVDVVESSVSFPRPGLSPMVWEKDKGQYRMLPGVKETIMRHLDKYPGFNIRDVAATMYVVGSIGTNQYEDDADIDVHFVPHADKIPEGKSDEDWQKDVKHFNKNPVTRDQVGTHPIEIYMQLLPAQDFLSDSVYDLATDTWLVGPKIVPPHYNPYEAYEEAYDMVRDMVKGTDVKLGELKRDVIDYFVLQDAIKNLPPKFRDKLREQLQEKLTEVEKDIDDLLKDKKEWTEMRKKASSPLTKKEALQDLKMVRNWKDKNALFKFLARYEYLKVISALEDLKDEREEGEEDLSPGDMETIRQVLCV